MAVDNTGYDAVKARDDLKKDFEAGLSYGKEIVPDLPTLYDDPDIQALLQKNKDLGRTRTDEELKIERESGVSKIKQNTAGISRRLEGLLSRQGVRGAQAGSQLANVELQGLDQERQLEQGMFLGQKQEERIAARDSLGYETELTKGAKQFDIGQQQATLEARLGVGTLFSQLGESERSAQRAMYIADTENREKRWASGATQQKYVQDRQLLIDASKTRDDDAAEIARKTQLIEEAMREGRQLTPDNVKAQLGFKTDNERIKHNLQLGSRRG